MKNFLKLSLLVTLLTGAVEMRAPEGEAPVVEASRANDQAAIAAKQAAIKAHNDTSEIVISKIVPKMKTLTPVSLGLPVDNHVGGISLAIVTKSTFKANDGTVITLHQDAEGKNIKTEIVHGPSNISEWLGLAGPKKTTIIHNSDGSHQSTTKTNPWLSSRSQKITDFNNLGQKTKTVKTTFHYKTDLLGDSFQVHEVEEQTHQLDNDSVVKNQYKKFSNQGTYSDKLDLVSTTKSLFI